MKRRIAGLIPVLLLLSACGASGGAAEPTPRPPADGSASPPPEGGASGGGGIDHPTGDDAILVVTSSGGMLPVQMQVTSVPQLVITGDGRVIMQGAQTLEYPGPALPALVERRLSESGVQAILVALEATNLFTGDLELRGLQAVIADAADTVFTVRAGGQEAVASVYALGMLAPDMEPPAGVGAAELEAHRVLAGLNERLMTLDQWLPADAWATEEWVPYQAEAFRLYVRDVTDEPAEADVPPDVREWPMDGDPAAFGEEIGSFADGTRCGVVDGGLGATWLAELSEARQNTLWSDGGDRRYRVSPRPLLPHEEAACPELTGSA